MENSSIYSDRIPENYRQNVLSAVIIFKNALVFNPISSKLEHLTNSQKASDD